MSHQVSSSTLSNHVSNNSFNELNSLNDNFETRFKLQDVDQISARATVSVLIILVS